MEEDPRDWELLQDSNPNPNPNPNPEDSLEEERGGGGGGGGDSDDGISPNYFALDSDMSYIQTRVCEKARLGDEEGVKRSWIDPNSHSWYSQKTIARDFGEPWTSEESSDEQNPPSSAETEGGRTDKFEGVVGAESGGGRMVLWWKVPLEVLKSYAFKIRPFWSISLAAALFGVAAMIGRQLYDKARKKTGNSQIKISIDDKKKALQFMVRAARLNEAFSVVRRLSILRTTFPTPGTTPLPAIAWK